MFKLNDNELLEYIKEDVPYFDLTTTLQDMPNKRAKLQIFTRENVIVACSEEAARVAQLIGCEINFVLPSKAVAKQGDILLEFSGDYENVQSAWRSAQLILEYSCKIATYAHEMKQKIANINPHCELLVTRKHFPFAKRFCIKSIMCGGAMPHRLGLSETVLLFEHHRKVYDNNETFYKALKEIKTKALEKKIVVEPRDFDDAIKLMENGADVLQMDKTSLEVIKEVVSFKNKHYPHVKILGAGGISKENVKEFVDAGVDGVVTSQIYFCGMADMGSKMDILQ
ncbi:molybdenum utilization protein ModD [sediment metagenome]|uniref:Putative pyrophosphorylase ModD n=1 Tax=sediment metagenome TaxID=749907 RepID=D9PHM0_9ZZZZ